MKLKKSKTLAVIFILFSHSYLQSEAPASDQDIESLRVRVTDRENNLNRTLKESELLRIELDRVTKEIVDLKLQSENGGVASFLTKRSLEARLKQSKEIEIRLNALDAEADSLFHELISMKNDLINALGRRIDELHVAAENERKQSEAEGLMETLEEISKLHYELFAYQREILEDTLSRSERDLDLTLRPDDSELEIRAKLDAVKQRQTKIQAEITLLGHQLGDLEVDKHLNEELLYLNQEMAEADLGLEMDFSQMNQVEKLETKILDIRSEIDYTKRRIASLEVRAIETEVLVTEFQQRLNELVEAREKGRNRR